MYTCKHRCSPGGGRNVSAKYVFKKFQNSIKTDITIEEKKEKKKENSFTKKKL